MKGTLLTQEEIDEMLEAMKVSDCEEEFILDIEKKSQLVINIIGEYRRRKEAGEKESDLIVIRKLITYRFLRLAKTPFKEISKMIIGS